MTKKYTITLESYQELEDLKYDLENLLRDFQWDIAEASV
jgi:hypothetical protein